jgi:hypothetical protein
MPRQRNLVLNKSQEDALSTYLEKRVQSLVKDNKERIDADKKSEKDYRNAKAYRALGDTVFAHENMSIPLTSYVVDHFSARTEDELFSRSPFCQFAPEGPADTDMARGLDRFANYRLFKLGKVCDSLLEAQNSQWIHRAQILKAIYDEDVDEWDDMSVNVLHDATTQQPVEILNHGFIIEGQDGFTPTIDPVTGVAVEALDADPTFKFDPTRHGFAQTPKPVRMREVLYSGARSREIDSDCFMAPSDAKTLDEAEIIWEGYDKPKSWLKERFLERPWLTWAQFEGRIGDRNGRRKTPGARAEVSKETLSSIDPEASTYAVEEIWLERDVLGWGKAQRIVIWREKKTKLIIDCEFQKKVTPTGRHPYTAIAPWKPHGGKYWWGFSIPEMMEPFQDYIDKQWNRHSFRNAINSTPIIGEHKDATVGKKSFRKLKPFDTVELEEDKTIQDWLEVFVFPKLDLDTQDLIEKAIYWCHFWLGISNISRGDYSDVPQNTTLGGQEATLREASKLSKRWTRRIKVGYEEHINKLLGICVATMDPQEAYTYLENDQAQSAWIAQDTLKGLPINVKLLVGREDGTQGLQQQQMAMQLIERYFSYPPQMQQAVRPVYKKSLFLLGYDDVDTLLPAPMMPMMIDPATGHPVPAPQGMAAGAPPPDVAAGGGDMVPIQDAAAAGAAAQGAPAQ